MKGMENRRYDTVIFDLDGTLLDTLADLTNSTNIVMEQYEMPGYSMEQVRGFVGNGIRRLLEQAVSREISAEEFEQIYRSFREHYDLHCMDETRPYPGILSLLEWLKKEGFQMAIVSNKADFAVKKLNSIYFRDLIGVAVGERDGCRKKPAPDSVFWALCELAKTADQEMSFPLSEEDAERGMIPEKVRKRAVYVGDSEVDLLTARNAGLDCIAVSWGFRSREALLAHGACEELIAANADELKEMLTVVS